LTNFSHFQELAVKADNTAELTLHQVDIEGVSPTLIVGPATEANKPYFNALLKRSGRNARQVSSGKINAGMIEDNRDEDRQLYPKYVVKGWKDMTGADGNAVEFNTENCIDFLNSIPAWLFDDIRNFCGNPQSFVASTSLDVGEVGNG